MTVIGNNIALSLGMVGALSIVRFRTAIKDSRDAVYIFWTIVATFLDNPYLLTESSMQLTELTSSLM